MKKRSLATGSILISGAVLLLGFQNCMQAKPVQAKSTAAGAVDAQSTLSLADQTCAEWLHDTSGFDTLASGASKTGEIDGFYQISSIGSIHDASGSVAIIGAPGTRAQIASITNFSGTLYLCDVDVGTVQNSNLTKLVIVNGNIGSLSGVSGPVILKGGSITGAVAASSATITTAN